MNHSLPPPLNKIIIEYCHYPKSYLGELKENTLIIYELIHYTTWPDLCYTNYKIANLPDKRWKFDVWVSSRLRLQSIKQNSDNILNLKQNGSYYQRGYYGY